MFVLVNCEKIKVTRLLAKRGDKRSNGMFLGYANLAPYTANARARSANRFCATPTDKNNVRHLIYHSEYRTA